MKINRQVVFDTETTGIKPEDGHRVVEFGGVELIDGKLTGKRLHLYFNPERDMPVEAYNVHGLSTEFLSDKPLFKDCAEEILEFLSGAEIIAHNIAFDTKFLNYELGLAQKPKIWSRVGATVDTLELSKMLFDKDADGKRYKHNLDALCERMGVTNIRTTGIVEGQSVTDLVDSNGKPKEGLGLHGALLDAELLAQVYLKMVEKYPVAKMKDDIEQKNWERPPVKRFDGANLKSVILKGADVKEHLAYVRNFGEKKILSPENLEKHVEYLKRTFEAQKAQMSKGLKM